MAVPTTKEETEGAVEVAAVGSGGHRDNTSRARRPGSGDLQWQKRKRRVAHGEKDARRRQQREVE